MRTSHQVELSGPPASTVGTGIVEVSVVIPCLNEAETVADCIRTARRAAAQFGINVEILVADNGSTDDSAAISVGAGARVVPVEPPGYGSALIGGIKAARGTYVIIGDADGSYDFSELPRFVDRLRSGDELVLGCRLPSGGGRVLAGAMPFLHRVCGNPGLSLIVRWFYGARVHDVYCGLRGITRNLFNDLDLRCSGMEFAVEMVAKASQFNRRISEVPITLRVDGRRTTQSHLRTFHDGWSTLCFLLICCPRWLYMVPGLILISLGLLGYTLAMPGREVLGARLDAHTLLISSLALLMGYESVIFALAAHTYGISAGLLPPHKRLTRVVAPVTPGRAVVAGALACVAGLALVLIAVNDWQRAGFGALDYAREMRLVIPGVTLTALGFQTVLAGFFLGMLRLGRQ